MKNIKIHISDRFAAEKKYVIDIIFNEFLGVNYELIIEKRDNYLIELPNSRSVILSDYFFNTDENPFTVENIPKELSMMNRGEVAALPIIYGGSQMFVNKDNVKCSADIFASVFYMLTRWEETALDDVDEHDRFIGKLSLAVRENFIDRPIVDEYVELLVSFISELDPSVKFRESGSETVLSSDIDSFRKYYNFNILKKTAGSLFKRHSFKECYLNFREFCMKKILKTKDPYDKFEEIFELAEFTGNKPLFFIPTAEKSEYDEGWLKGDAFKKTAEYIFENGGEIGLHYGYNSSVSSEKIIIERKRLEKAIDNDVISGRAHYLRFNVDTLFEVLEKAGIKHDHSLGYSYHPGFRCGTAHSYRPWNFKDKRPYDVTVHPLIVMDTTLYAHNGMSEKEMAEVISKFEKTVDSNGGKFSLLLHNSSPDEVFKAYRDALE